MGTEPQSCPLIRIQHRVRKCARVMSENLYVDIPGFIPPPVNKMTASSESCQTPAQHDTIQVRENPLERMHKYI